MVFIKKIMSRDIPSGRKAPGQLLIAVLVYRGVFVSEKKIKLSYLKELMYLVCAEQNCPITFDTEECINMLLELGVLDESKIIDDLKKESK